MYQKMKISKWIICMVVAIVAAHPLRGASPYKQKTAQAVDRIVEWRDSTGMWYKAGWWNSANILTAMIRYAEVTKQKKEFAPIIADVFEKNKHRHQGNYINEYYDDEGWWLLAWVDAYNLTGEKRYIQMAETIFEDMAGGWSAECGGGIWWRKPQEYKNAIANGLFNLSAARLFRATKKPHYKEWLMKNGQWYINTGMICKTTGLVLDGTKNCKPMGQTYTYNQGVAIAFLSEMYLVTRNKEYLKMAENIADSTIRRMISGDEVLKDPQEPRSLGGDGVQFKGIFIRHLGFLHRLIKKPSYKAFILRNSDSIISKAYDPQSRSYGSFWTGPFDRPNAGSHASATETLIEAYNLTR